MRKLITALLMALVFLVASMGGQNMSATATAATMTAATVADQGDFPASINQTAAVYDITFVTSATPANTASPALRANWAAETPDFLNFEQTKTATTQAEETSTVVNVDVAANGKGRAYGILKMPFANNLTLSTGNTAVT